MFWWVHSLPLSLQLYVFGAACGCVYRGPINLFLPSFLPSSLSSVFLSVSFPIPSSILLLSLYLPSQRCFTDPSLRSTAGLRNYLFCCSSFAISVSQRCFTRMFLPLFLCLSLFPSRHTPLSFSSSLRSVVIKSYSSLAENNKQLLLEVCNGCLTSLWCLMQIWPPFVTGINKRLD